MAGDAPGRQPKRITIWLDIDWPDDDENGVIGWYDHDYSENVGFEGNQPRPVAEVLAEAPDSPAYLMRALEVAEKLGIREASWAFVLFDDSDHGRNVGPLESKGYCLGTFKYGPGLEAQDEPPAATMGAIARLASPAFRELMAGTFAEKKLILRGDDWLDDVVVAELAACPHLAKLEELELEGPRVGVGTGRALAGSAHCANLRSLRIRFNPQPVDTKAVLAALASSTQLGSLVALAMNQVDPVGLGTLMQSSLAEQLTSLEIESPRSFGFFAATIAGALAGGRARKLQRLVVRTSDLTLDDLAALLASPAAAELRELSLRNVNDETLRAFAETHGLGRLETLSLGCYDRRLGTTGARMLARSAALGRLRALSLVDSQPGDEGLRALAESPHLGQLRSLSVSSGGIGDAGVSALAKSTSMTQLEELILDGGKLISDVGAQAIAASSALQHLRVLSLRSHKIGTTGALALAESPLLLRLERLSLEDNRELAKKAKLALEARFGNGVTL